MTKNLAATNSRHLATGPIAYCLLPIAFFLAGFSGVANAQTPQINLPDSAVQGDTFPAASLPQLTDRIKFCLDAVSNAKDINDVKRYSGLLIEGGYNRYDSNGYHAAFAAELARMSAPVLAKLDEAYAVPLAMSLSMVPELSMQPCLEAMVVSPSSAVRYFGWKGFLSVRAKVIAAGKGPTNKMTDLLSKQFAAEPSSVVLGVMLEMLDWPAPADSQLQKKSWDILQQAWPSMGSRVAGRDQEMSRSCRTAVTTLEHLWPTLTGKDQTKALQMLVDLMFYAASAYGDAGAEGLIADINAQLARDCETLLAKFTGIQKKSVSDALAAKDLKERKTAVPLAILESWGPDLKSKGVVAPKLPTPPAAPSTPEQP
jgi:hypothetical protein